MKCLTALAQTCILLGLLSPLTSAQDMPECAAVCLQNSLQAQDTCSQTLASPTDIACVCENEELMGAIQTCVLSTCTVKQALNAKNATMTLCGQPVRDITNITPIVSGVSGGVALLSVFVRTIITIPGLGLDDIFAIAAIVAALPMAILEFIMSADGFGKDIWTIPSDKIYRIVKFTWLTEVFYFIALAFTKISFLCFCLRIFPRKDLRKWIYGLIAISAAYGTASLLVILFNCLPISYIWTSWDGEHTGKCIDLHAFVFAHAGINIALDFIILGIPIPELLKLSLSTRKKIYIIMMFLLGTFTTIVSIVRLRALVQFSASTNPTYDNVPTAYWSVLECFVGIICVCMPGIRRFLAVLVPKCFGSTQNNSKYENNETPSKPWSGLVTIGSKKSKVSYPGRGITKTMETRIESKADEDDEIQLVNLGRAKGGWNAAGDDKASDASGRESERSAR